MTTDVDDDFFKLFESLNFFMVDLIWFWPVLSNEHTTSPAEGLPDCFGDERCEWVEHDKNLFES